MDNPVVIILAVVIIVLLLALLVLQSRRRPADSSSGSGLTDEVARELMATLAGTPTVADRGSVTVVSEDPTADSDAAETRRTARDDAERERAAATAAAEETRRRAAAQADAVRRAAQEEVARERAQLQSELDRIRSRAESEGRRAAELASTSLVAEKADLQAAQQALRLATTQLADDVRRAEKERLISVTARAEAEALKQLTADRQAVLEVEKAKLLDRERDLRETSEAVELRVVEHQHELERIGGMTADEAKSALLHRMEEQVRREAAIMGRRIEAEAEATAKTRARAIVADAVQRVASDQTAQSVVSVVHLPAEEIKGRIIGREGRNIRAFETVTGVNVIIDDTPEAVLLSCFDPVRREVGRITLLSLIEDGRIHPHRIEEAYERAQDEVEALCRRAAEDALIAVGIGELHPELMTILGHLKYRTSYGQNVLGHMVETAHIARGMAYEMGIDPTVLVRGSFLHDIGKALTHEARGSHAIVGAELARHYGESEEVAHCIEAHHDEVAPATVEAVLTQAADACSGGRPGARRESLESYVQRMERIEAIASSKRGVEKVFAMQAGRELRVMVKPEIVDDLEAHLIAREVAKQIEEELTYPGQVRVTVIRESRATEIAR
ncbi:MAG: ribonuclease Y [Nakamurella sp.]